ncbi:MAG: hypothetical protein PHG82_03475 [Candidatus Gracilibacteria bacterium]|nr:hypothetical protein [Candidatus Gracilibacteria bacterium]
MGEFTRIPLRRNMEIRMRSIAQLVASEVSYDDIGIQIIGTKAEISEALHIITPGDDSNINIKRKYTDGKLVIIEIYDPICEEIRNKLLEICPDILIVNNDELELELEEEIKKTRGHIIGAGGIAMNIIRVLEKHIKETTFILEAGYSDDLPFLGKKEKKRIESKREIFKNPNSNILKNSRKKQISKRFFR